MARQTGMGEFAGPAHRASRDAVGVEINVQFQNPFRPSRAQYALTKNWGESHDG